MGQKAANELGTHDMSGNVWEWCHDWHPDYVGVYRVGRGGCWGSDPGLCRVSYRCGSFPGIGYNSFGFRLSLPAGQ